MKRAIPLVLMLIVVFLAIAVQAAAKRPSTPVTAQIDVNRQTDEQGAVTVFVIPPNFTTPGGTLDFDVSISTHSVELDMDLAALSTLTTSTGLEVKAISWDAPRGGHHVSGKLSFPLSVNGTSLADQSGSLILTIRDVDAPARIFKWDIKQ
jgi:hypothetical protein